MGYMALTNTNLSPKLNVCLNEQQNRCNTIARTQSMHGTGRKAFLEETCIIATNGCA